MKVTLYTLAAAGGAFLSIPATQLTRRVEIVEDDSGAEQGIIYKLPYDNFTQQFQISAGKGVILGNTVANQNNQGVIVGRPIQKDVSQTVTLRPADILLKATSATAATTKIRVTEYD